jgi:hypothetical protein
VVAAVLVVGLSLLPHALACEGIAAWWVRAWATRPFPRSNSSACGCSGRGIPERCGSSSAIPALLLHRFGDGIAMSVDGHGYGVLWALGAHEVPIVALVTMAFARRGLASALSRAALLGSAARSAIGSYARRPPRPGTSCTVGPTRSPPAC